MELFAHQTTGVEIARKRPRFYYQLDCRTGKTMMMLSVCNERPIRTLVLAPKTVVTDAWVRDAAHFPSLRVQPILADNPRRASTILRGEWDVAVTNYAMFRTHYNDFKAVGVCRLVVDEASVIKNTESAISKKVLAFSELMSEVYCLSANAAPNGPHELWAVLRAVGGTNLPPIKWLFSHFTPVRKTVRVKGGSLKSVIERWSQTHSQAESLRNLMARHSWSLRRADCFDIPKEMECPVRVVLGPAEAKAYEAAKYELRIVCPDGDVTSIKAQAALTKMRQLVGGAVLVEGEPQEIGTSKLEALAELLDEIGPQPVVIWFEYSHERERICRMLEERGETFGVVDGQSKDNGLSIAMFQDGKLQRIICHPQSAGHGVTLNRAVHMVYFSLNFSHDLHKQSRDRIVRPVNPEPVCYHYLIAELPAQEESGRKTVDHAMSWTLRQKAKAADGMAAALRDAGIEVAIASAAG